MRSNGLLACLPTLDSIGAADFKSVHHLLNGGSAVRPWSTDTDAAHLGSDVGLAFSVKRAPATVSTPLDDHAMPLLLLPVLPKEHYPHLDSLITDHNLLRLRLANTPCFPSPTEAVEGHPRKGTFSYTLFSLDQALHLLTYFVSLLVPNSTSRTPSKRPLRFNKLDPFYTAPTLH